MTLQNLASVPRATAIDLKEKIRALETQLDTCQARIAELEGRRPHAAGSTGEVHLASILGVEPTIWNSRYDILTPTGCKLEVKTSKLNQLKHADGRRWGWSKPLGGDNEKQYDQLIRLGEPDPRHVSQYSQPLGRYVMFDIPFSDVPKFLNSQRDIFLGSNPLRVHSRVASPLYLEFQITEIEFARKYRNA